MAANPPAQLKPIRETLRRIMHEMPNIDLEAITADLFAGQLLKRGHFQCRLNNNGFVVQYEE